MSAHAVSRYAVTLHTAEHRGDHAADVTYALVTVGSETVDALLTRVALATPARIINPNDRVVIQRILGEGTE